MLLRVQAVQAVGSQEDVGLPLQGLAKRVAALRYHIVKDTARREDVHRVGLKRDAGVRGLLENYPPHSAAVRTGVLLLLFPP